MLICAQISAMREKVPVLQNEHCPRHGERGSVCGGAPNKYVDRNFA